MAYDSLNCAKCKKLNWFYIDYHSKNFCKEDDDGFKCFVCGHENPWPGWDEDMGEPECFADGMSPGGAAKEISGKGE